MPKQIHVLLVGPSSIASDNETLGSVQLFAHAVEVYEGLLPEALRRPKKPRVAADTYLYFERTTGVRRHLRLETMELPTKRARKCPPKTATRTSSTSS